jgi:hypothetical protein
MMPVNWNPDRAQLRRFGLASLVAFGALGAWALFRHSIFGLTLSMPVARGIATGLGAVALLSALLALVAPMALLPLYRALTAVSVPIGYVVSHVVMGIVYFGVLTPIAFVFRSMGRDPLHRTPDRSRASYWEPRVAPDDVRRYYRQF